jgi:hypothetical protein
MSFDELIAKCNYIYTYTTYYVCPFNCALCNVSSTSSIIGKTERQKRLHCEKTSTKNRLFSAFAPDGPGTTTHTAANPLQKYSTYDHDAHTGREEAGEHPAETMSRLHSGGQGGGDQEAAFTQDSGHVLAPDPAVFCKSAEELLPFHELRLYARLSDKDLRFHAGRIYLEGINSPLQWMGGAWHWPVACPHSLLYAVHTEKYISFTQSINDLMDYQRNGWEMFVYLFLLILVPPYAEHFLLGRRLVRAKVLINSLATVRNPFFQSEQCSLRLSVSPDLTVAYVDILVDIDHHQKAAIASQQATTDKQPTSTSSRAPVKRMGSKHDITPDFPLPGPLGQPKLPIFIRFCGMGTYFSPWHLDTNDLLLQAIPLANDVSVFIDKAFINFVYELNKILKSLRRHCLKDDLIVLLKVHTYMMYVECPHCTWYILPGVCMLCQHTIDSKTLVFSFLSFVFSCRICWTRNGWARLEALLCR